jgi:hypothetical protein
MTQPAPVGCGRAAEPAGGATGGMREQPEGVLEVKPVRERLS